MTRNARSGPQVRGRRSGNRFLSASIVGLSALLLVGGVAYVQYERGEAPFIGRLGNIQQARAENPLPPRDLAQTEAARAQAEKRLSDAMALQFPPIPRLTPIERPVVAEKTASEKPVADVHVAELPREALPKASVPLAAQVAAPEYLPAPTPSPATTIVNRSEPVVTPAPAPAPSTASTMPRDEQDALLARVDGLLRQGDVGSARAILNRLVRENNARAAFILAQSYDPKLQSQARIIGMRPDADLARQLYAQALRGGVSEAQPAMAALEPASP